ncbi:hypothetical protein Hanom_Chr07g00583291 [Helianthus anomalus]
MARFQTFWIQMRKNKHLDESRKTDQTSGTKMAFTLIQIGIARRAYSIPPGV